ncbi:MAG: tetratricopeptide repeat protein [Gemmatimonadaceae bacterium]|nr:tetratricopeptide repeat protein [Gemmatimonadaceae bacterium]
MLHVDVARAQTSAAPARQNPSPALRWADSVRRLIDGAVIRGDTLALRNAMQVADRALKAMPGDGLLLHYRGYATYRLAERVPSKEEARRDSLHEDVLEWLDQSSEALPMPETSALRSMAMGRLMANSMLRGMRLGAPASRAESEALEATPANPRALLLVAVGTWYKPAMFGGGKDKARALLDRAFAAFSADRPAVGRPQWGLAEAWAWRGIMEADAGRTDAARSAYDRALELEPDYQWVRWVLRPALRPAS